LENGEIESAGLGDPPFMKSNLVTETKADKLIRDVRRVVEEAEDLIKITSGDIEDETRQARANLAGAILVARESCKRLDGTIRDTSFATGISARQYSSALISAGFLGGVVVGFWLARRAVRSQPK
jgi:ElaB/YqjD/DUF883 family membrane-anchored ribosome-binding protein